MDSLCGSNGFGGSVPLDPMRIQSWQAVTGTPVETWEGRILLEMARARQRGPEEAFQTDMPATQGISVAIFDALFG